MQKMKKKVDNEIIENKYYKNKETKERRRYKDENLWKIKTTMEKQ